MRFLLEIKMDYKYFDVRGTFVEISTRLWTTEFGNKMSLSAVSAWNKKYMNIL